MVEAIPSWKYFIFGGESTDYGEAQPRAFGELVNTACFLDIETMRWAPIHPEDDLLPKPREYAGVSYDQKDSRLLVFGGWNNRWLNDIYALNVSKIVGPSYAVTSMEPVTSQLSGGTTVTIRGVGFKDQNIRVFFTAGDSPIAQVTPKSTIEVGGIHVSETELTCETPNFDKFGACNAVVQLTISGGDLTTTFAPFSYFMNTRAYMSLCYGPAIQDACCAGAPAEFIIQARNDSAENRTSGHDDF
jgi:dynein heavy chain